MTTPRTPDTVDPAALKYVLGFLQFGGAMVEVGDLPAPIVRVLNIATTAYIRSQRDPSAFRDAVTHGMPVLLRTIDACIREELASQIDHDEKALRDPEEIADIGISGEQLSRELTWMRTAYAWLYPRTAGRKGA